MLSKIKSINLYFFTIFTGLSHLGYSSVVLAETSNAETPNNNVISSINDNISPSEKVVADQAKVNTTSELIRKLRDSKRQQNQFTNPPQLNNSELTSQATIVKGEDSKEPIRKTITNSFQSNNSDLITRIKNSRQQQTNNLVTSTPSSNISELNLATNTGVQIKNIQILGSTVFSQSELDEAIKPFIGKPANFQQILAIRTAVTDFYTQKGYTTSGAFLPPQDISTGLINVQVVEGELERIEIQGLRKLREDYVRSRIRNVAGNPINLRRLETALQLLQIDPLFTSVQAELKSGTSPGRSVLELTLKEARPISASFSVANSDSPSVGSIRGTSTFNYQNLLGFGDRLSGQLGYTSGANSYDINYGIPLNANNGTLSLRYANSNSRIIEEPFSPLDIIGRSQTLSFGFRQPIVYNPNEEFTLGLSVDLRESQTFLLKDIPFSFSPGPENGKSRVTVVRLSQDWISRTPKSVLAARSQFSLGLGAFGATINADAPDGQFVNWVGQFQWVQNLGKDVISVARVATQLTPNSLLPLEQFSIGGVDTVRGYRQNQFVADNGINSSFEVRFPVMNDKSWGSLQVAPFFDVGKVWNNSGAGVDTRIFASTGLSLRWQIGSFATRLDWGLPLTSINRQGDSLQDNGLFFSLTYQP